MKMARKNKTLPKRTVPQVSVLWPFLKKELGKYSKELLKKKEVIVLNKVDLLEKKNVEEIINKFSKNKKCEVVTLSTLNKDSVTKIKAKLLNYVS